MNKGGRAAAEGGAAEGQLVAVAVDSDKNSHHALKWAADHLISRNHIFLLVHVRKRVSLSTPSADYLPLDDKAEEDESVTAFSDQIDLHTKELLLPFQCFCSRKGLQCKEIILDDVDVAKALVNFVLLHSVDKLVLGASSRYAFTRTFVSDVPSSVSKTAPEFCSIYVIAKGKISSVRPAPLPNAHGVKRSASNFKTAGSQFQSTKSEPDARNPIEASERSPLPRNNERNSRFNQAQDHRDFSYQSIASCPSPSRTSIDWTQNYYSQQLLDGGGQQSCVPYMRDNRVSPNWTQNYYSQELLDGGGQQSSVPYMRDNGVSRNEKVKASEFHRTSGAYTSSAYGSSGYVPSVLEDGQACWSNKSLEDMELEMRRLKLELKQRIEMYEDGSREAHSSNVGGDHRIGGTRLTKLEMEEEQKFKPSVEAEQDAQKMKIDLPKVSNDNGNVLPKLMDSTNLMNAFSSHVRYRRYSIEEIQKATNNFSNALKIGEGGYGPVFKSTLDHTLVAIKTLRSDATQGMKQFQQEVEVLSCIRHPNMVLLMGACPEYGCLVYEYMANGSLEDCLLCKSNSPPLSWQLRFKIAAEVATGLLFLHQTKPEPLVHRDLKPGNILIDHNFVSKIADVGLARLIPPSAADATMYHMTAAAGTFCYIDPEYQKTGMLGTKSDIYALGIILLQLITAAPPMGVAHNVERAMEMGKFEQVLDPNVQDWPMEETIKFAKLALKCAELRRKDRPDLGSVILPELNQLRELALSRMQSRWMYHVQLSNRPK